MPFLLLKAQEIINEKRISCLNSMLIIDKWYIRQQQIFHIKIQKNIKQICMQYWGSMKIFIIDKIKQIIQQRLIEINSNHNKLTSLSNTTNTTINQMIEHKTNLIQTQSKAIQILTEIEDKLRTIHSKIQLIHSQLQEAIPPLETAQKAVSLINKNN